MPTFTTKRRKAREALRKCIFDHTGRQISGSGFAQKPMSSWDMELFKWEEILECCENNLASPYNVQLNHLDARATHNVTLSATITHIAGKMD